LQKASGGSQMSAAFDKLDKGELRGSIDCHEEVELAFGVPTSARST